MKLDYIDIYLILQEGVKDIAQTGFELMMPWINMKQLISRQNVVTQFICWITVPLE